MVYVRGHAWDFDHWDALGNDGWGYDDVLPYFKKSENQERGPSKYHGTGGPHNVADPRWVPPISEAFVAAGVDAGLPRNEDFNGETQEGVGFFQLNQKGGERHSAADAYLRPVLSRANLRVESRALATRILFEDGRAVGVTYVQAGTTHEVRAAREVILAAGVIGSPQLLMLSGIGPAEHLESLGIPVLLDLPGVGSNLQDHPRAAVTYASKLPLGLDAAAAERALDEYRRSRTGPLSGNGVGAGALVRLSPEDPAPGVKVFLTANPADDTFSLHVALLRPASRGEVRLRSNDPEQPPLIRVNYLDDPRDVQQLARGLAIAQRIAEAEGLASYRGDQLAPGPDAWEPEALERHIRETATTFFHLVGTCRMGGDDAAVVDAQLRVKGVAGLRVIDASVMPTLIGGATHAATVMIAEKGADLLKADW
jgi:choline dehydrogenase